MSRQATINVGTIGHVAHGKSTVVKALTGVLTVRFKNEKERNITIKLGYANAKVNQQQKNPFAQQKEMVVIVDFVDCWFVVCIFFLV